MPEHFRGFCPWSKHRRNPASTSPQIYPNPAVVERTSSRSKSVSEVFCRHRGKQASTNFQIQLLSSACQLLTTHPPTQLSNSTHTSLSALPDPTFELLAAFSCRCGFSKANLVATVKFFALFTPASKEITRDLLLRFEAVNP